VVEALARLTSPPTTVLAGWRRQSDPAGKYRCPLQRCAYGSRSRTDTGRQNDVVAHEH
jgi:hypothetical protein